MKNILLVRHGHTDYNSIKIFQPDDANLNKLGKERVRRTAEVITHSDVDIIISSPLARAKETADIISDTVKCHIELSNLLREFDNPPCIRGKSYDDLKASICYEAWMKTIFDPVGSSIAESENYADLFARAGEVIKMLNSRPENNIVVTTHSVLIRAIVAKVLLGENADAHQLEKAINSIKIENGAILKLYEVGANGSSDWRILFE